MYDVGLRVFAIVGVTFTALILGIIIQAFCEWIGDIREQKAWEYKYKHRFDKPPTAKCYCIDCEMYGGKEHDDKCFKFDWYVASDWFCWDARKVVC